MDYQIKYYNKGYIRTPISLGRAGFSLIELLIVIGIFSIFAGMSTSVYYNMRSHTDLELAINTTVEAVRFAQSSAQSGRGDSKWGVEILSDKIVIFKGDSYVSRLSASDEIFDYSGKVLATGLSEIVFEKISGTTVNTGTINLSNSTENKDLTINEKGTVGY